MKKIRGILVFLILSGATLGVSAQTIPSGCIRCNTGNDGWCRGTQITACLDDGTLLHHRCLIGATKLLDCPVDPE